MLSNYLGFCVAWAISAKFSFSEPSSSDADEGYVDGAFSPVEVCVSLKGTSSSMLDVSSPCSGPHAPFIS